MDRTDQYMRGAIGVLSRARKFNPSIGSYQGHFINEQFNFTVKLSNGRIVIPMTMAKNQEVQPSSISVQRIHRVANWFQNNAPNPQQQVGQTNNPPIPSAKTKLSFW
jgi:hypothetical protein